jgi:protoheme IX farnesyltransferase
MTASLAARIEPYYTLTKPRVVFLILVTAVVGMFLATDPQQVLPPLSALVFGTLGIGLAAASAAAINHVLDRRIDERMKRTRRRPLPTGKLDSKHALAFAILLAAVSMVMLFVAVNTLTAVLTFASLIGYAVVYTLYLKHATPQNIVIGGASGAAPPLLGWTAVTGTIEPGALLLFLIIFVWTPPHFWALAIARRDEYANAGVPMLPVTHGIPYTKFQILLYSLLLVAVSVMPFVIRMSGWLYLVGALILGAVFVSLAWRLRGESEAALPMRLFSYSVTYLLALFGLLLVDHYVPLLEKMF